MKRNFSIASTKRSSASENHNNPMQSQAKLSGPTSAAQSITYIARKHDYIQPDLDP